MPSLNDEHMPHVTSRVARFSMDPDGNADGMVLLNGVEVHFAPYLSNAVLTAVRIGDRITVYGMLPKPRPMIVAAIIEAMNGARIEDCGQ
jgi:hypothetical protein